MGLVCGEFLERDSRDPNNRYSNAQIDETAFGQRKYKKGKRVRKHGIQWGLTFVEVDFRTGKTIDIDMQFLPLNKRGIDQITPMVLQRMKPYGNMHTDSWKAYIQAAKAAKCTHYKVNHSKHFKDPETGVHTNNVEGMHSVVKKDARRQFDCLPYVNQKGGIYYMDLLIWRAKCRLQNLPFFKSFMKILYEFTHNPLDDFVHVVQLWEDEVEDIDEDDNDWFIDREEVEESDDDNNNQDPDYVP